MSERTYNILSHIFFILCITVIAVAINFKHLNEPPAYIHAWAQADNYSLALGFINNGGDLFHPQTLIYNKQQKGFNDPLTLVTACDLPLHHWIVSKLMLITGSYNPWVFRGFTLFVALLGLWSLYFLSFILTISKIKSFFATIFTTTAPSFAYYSASFLPSLPALSLSTCGLLFYVIYLRNNKNVHLFLAILLFTLAAMIRTSFAILWIAVICFQVLRIFHHETSIRSSLLPFCIGLVLFFSWWLWSLHLRQTYGSLFLGSLLPVNSWEEAKQVFSTVHDRWEFHYFQRLAHWMFVIIAAAAILFFIVGKNNATKNKQLSLLWFVLIWFLGEILFSVAMLKQFSDHDYYFLDSLFLPIVFSLILLLRTIPNAKNRWLKGATLCAVMLFSLYSYSEACEMQKIRRYEGIAALNTAIRYKNANSFLEKEGYGSKELRFLTLFSYPQNTPFVMMNREGYAVMWTNPEIIAHALTFDFDYILVEDEVYVREYENAPDILSRLERIAGDGELSLCTLSDTVLHPTPEHFLK